MQLDDVDKKILAILVTEGHLSNAEISSRIHLSPPACWKRLRRLEEKLIKGYYPEIDYKLMGMTVFAYISVVLDSHAKDVIENFEREIVQIPNLLSYDVISGRYDYILQFAAENIDALHNILIHQVHAIKSVKEINSSFSYRKVVRKPILQPISDILPS